MPASPSKLAGTAGEILLLEEYGALAAAISAALKKFAPGHPVRVAPSFSVALGGLTARAPVLAIVDFDPPLPGILRFLDQFRADAPTARLMVIAAGLPRDILEEAPTSITFVEKPFQLEALGQTIARLLRDDGPSPRTVAHLNLCDIIPLLALEAWSGVVAVSQSGQDAPGELHLTRGHLLHAEVSGLAGVDALREMIRWPAPQFALSDRTVAPQRTIEGTWATALLRVVRSLPPAARATGPLRSPPDLDPAPAPATPPVPRDGKKVLIIDDTETLRVFVEEMLAASDPRLQIAAAPDGGDGLRLAHEFRPDLILLDYVLPDFNGDEVCRRLLENETLRRIPVLMMSGHIAEMNETADRYENVVGTLAKPFVSEMLIKTVAEMLAQPRPRRRREPAAAKPAPPAKNGHAPSPTPPSPTPPIALPAAVMPEPAPEPKAPALTAAHIPAAASDAVVLNIPLEVVSLQFTADLRITALKARPASAAITLHVDPRAIPAMHLPEAVFEIVHVDLDQRGHLRTVRIAPTPQRPPHLRPLPAFHVERLALLPANGGSGLQITPAPGEPLRIQLIAAFELSGVELSPAFSIAQLALTAPPGARMRVILPGQAGKVGITFETAQVLLDRKARIAEILLDSVIAPPQASAAPQISALGAA